MFMLWAKKICRSSSAKLFVSGYCAVLALLFTLLLLACSNIDIPTNLKNSTGSYLALDDSEYPYAGLPRIVIETDEFTQVKDRETEVPARLQVYGKDSPTDEIKFLTIRGRGNTSWVTMPKKSYKLEFNDKYAFLGMPQNRDWALIANYADKTLIKNYLAYHLSATLGLPYTPKCQFVELFLNKEYQGVYLLTETIKVAKKRVNIPENDSSYLVEVDSKYKKDEQVFLSEQGKPFHVLSPKNASYASLSLLQNHINSFEEFLKTPNTTEIANWIDIDSYIKYYWIQEYSKNFDGAFYTSVFFTWEKGGPIKMGPVWDFDLAFGGHPDTLNDAPEGWYIKKTYWTHRLFKKTSFRLKAYSFFDEHLQEFKAVEDTIESLRNRLRNAAKNNFTRWNILNSTEHENHIRSYSSYDEAIDDLIAWHRKRLAWIKKELE